MAERQTERERSREDLDETRRLLYMLLAAKQGVVSVDLAGTLANALAHHSKLVTIDEATKLSGWLTSGAPMPPEIEDLIYRLLGQIIAKLGDAPGS
jgi:hypothetical protein